MVNEICKHCGKTKEKHYHTKINRIYCNDSLDDTTKFEPCESEEDYINRWNKDYNPNLLPKTLTHSSSEQKEKGIKDMNIQNPSVRETPSLFSKRIQINNCFGISYWEEDVKEFILKIEEDIQIKKIKENKYRLTDLEIYEIIDKRAGKEMFE